MRLYYTWLAGIVALALIAAWLAFPDTEPDFMKRGGDAEALAECELISANPAEDCAEFRGSFEYQLGLDLVGGLRVLMQAELPSDAFTQADLQETANNVARRIGALGTADVTVQTVGGDRILVELPGETDPERAVRTIQQTALLEFVDFRNVPSGQFTGQRILTTEQFNIIQNRRALAEESGQPLDDPELEAEGLVNPATGQPFQTVMTGDGLAAAVAQIQISDWIIVFDVAGNHQILHPDFNTFGEYTAASIGQPMAIVLDGVVISAPVIRDRLDTGGTISGNFTEDEAKTLALQLRSGALAIPLRVESTELVGATLGDASVQASVRAGIIGVVVVLSFMFIYYRLPGFCADIALLIFLLLNFLVYKTVPITLTLPAITGFLISIGAAVDGTILIFERFKEELRGGQSLNAALDVGFSRAWTSIRDSNTSTILICGILFLFGQTPGASIVSGFAITLALGLILNMFTAMVVTRTFLYVVIDLTREQVNTRRWLLGV
ncbi:MAG: protein translocase subunit SecD [Anaerolineaceae bacterium]|nr:MAG: protein translocase subunit SecD [Anaerolineaceae bacterium]